MGTAVGSVGVQDRRAGGRPGPVPEQHFTVELACSSSTSL